MPDNRTVSLFYYIWQVVNLHIQLLSPISTIIQKTIENNKCVQ